MPLSRETIIRCVGQRQGGEYGPFPVECPPAYILLNGSLPRPDLVSTLGHEVAHAWLEQAPRPEHHHPPAAERADVVHLRRMALDTGMSPRLLALRVKRERLACRLAGALGFHQDADSCEWLARCSELDALHDAARREG